MKKTLLTFIALAALSLTAYSQNWDEMIKAVSSDRAVDDYFGYNVVIDNNRAVVSSYLQDLDASGGNSQLDAGAVYVFELNNNVWTETAKLVASDRSPDDRFGCRVAISNDKIIIGAFFDKDDASGGTPLNEAGSAYIFELIAGVWTETAKLVASDRSAGYRFGFDVAISGNTAIVGSYYNATDVSNVDPLTSSGGTYVFELIGGLWTETAKLVASDRHTYSYFGYSVDMDGSTIIVGSQGNRLDASVGGGAVFSNSGAVYVFEEVAGVWTETTKLVASDRASNDNFGFDAAINNNRIVIGAFKEGENGSGGNNFVNAGAAYIFELIGGVWTETSKLVASDRAAEDQFGSSVDISEDKIIVGARYVTKDASGANALDGAGAAYIFEFSGGAWTETTKLVASDRGENDNFGTRVSISGDMAIVGALFEDEDATGSNTQNDAGSVYIYNTCNDNTAVTVSGNTITATATGASYQWLNCDNGNSPIASETNQSFTPTNNGNYAVVVTKGICSDTSVCSSIMTVSVDELKMVNNLNVYPNPTSTMLYINSSENFKNITIVNINGKVIREIPTSNNSIDVSNLPAGVYLAQIVTNKGLSRSKFIKE